MLTAEQVAKVGEKQIENLIRKAAEGRPLTQAELAQLKDHQSPAKYAKTKAELAKHLGINRTTLRKYLAMDGAPQATVAGYELEAVADFLAAHADVARAGAQGDLKTLRAEEIFLRCELLKIKIANEKGKYMLADDVRNTWVAHCSRARQVLLGLPQELAPTLAGQPAPEIETRLDDAMDKALAALRESPLTVKEKPKAAPRKRAPRKNKKSGK